MSEEIEDHRLLNDSENEPFSSVLERRVSRRSIMRGGLNVAAVSMLAGFGLTACSDDDNDNNPSLSEDDRAAAMMLAFEAVAGSKQDAVVVPSANASQENGSAALTAGTAAATATAGYTAQVVMPWGTPINNNGQAWSQSLAFTPEIQANSVGMHHDGMHNFPISDDTASSNFIMALNNEYIDQWALHNGRELDGFTINDGRYEIDSGPRDPASVRTEINAHGVTIVELRRDENRVWDVVRNSQYNRRVTSATPCDLAGPVAGSQYVVTAYDNEGMSTRGTNNNCANGFTPWGTYLTCEENWPNYFMKSQGREPDDDRLGIQLNRSRYYVWERAAQASDDGSGEFARFDATPRGDTAADDYRNEPRTFGYIVEIDPYDATSRPVKRTALGRFRHEGCWPGKLVEGEPVVFYSGHDARNEYIYKFVSDAKWNPADANMAGATTDRLAIGAKYMNEGTLYAAKFNADGTGEWLELEPDTIVPVSAGSRYAGQTLASALGLEAGDRAGIIIHTCDAADLMGATPMDRPEWGTVDPVSGEVYMTLTNNSDRLPEGQRATVSNGDSIEEPGASYGQAPVNAANPRAGNSDGQVIRWVEPSPGETTFNWDVFVFGKVPTSDDQNLSSLSEQNFFSSCDGLWYDDRGDGQGILWIETDSGTQYTNDQVLAVVPQGLSKGDNASVIHEGNQAQLKRFAVGPNGCEVTGIFATPDKTALFINIQHPSNWPIDDNGSNTPDATIEPTGNVRPRASTVVIQKADGGQIGV